MSLLQWGAELMAQLGALGVKEITLDKDADVALANSLKATCKPFAPEEDRAVWQSSRLFGIDVYSEVRIYEMPTGSDEYLLGQMRRSLKEAARYMEVLEGRGWSVTAEVLKRIDERYGTPFYISHGTAERKEQLREKQ